MSWWGDHRCDRLAVIGLGQIGASVGLASRAFSAATKVVGYDVSPDAAQAALGAGAATELAESPVEAVRDADLVVLAAPVLEIAALVDVVAPHLGPRCVMTDVGSAKGPVVEVMERAAGCRGRCIGGHPMAGGERAGPGAASPDLFLGRKWVLCPGPNTRADTVQTMRSFVSALGAVPLIMDAAAHDREVARTSHLPYLTAVGTCLALKERPAASPPWQLAGSSLRDCTRVALSSPEMAGSFCLANREHLARALREHALWMGRLLAALDEGDGPALQALLRAGREFREGIPFASPPAAGAPGGGVDGESPRP